MGMGREAVCEMLAEDAVRERTLAERTWITRDGREIPVEEMGDAHLGNAIRMLRRGGCLGGMALDALEMLEAEALRRRRMGTARLETAGEGGLR